jgi:hypothetical protein
MDRPIGWASWPKGNGDLVAAAMEGAEGEPQTLGEFLAQMEAEARHQEQTFGRALAKRETNRVSHFRRVLFGGDRRGGGNGGLVSRVLGTLEAHGPLPEGWGTHVGEALLIELGLADASAAARHAHLSSNETTSRGGPLVGPKDASGTPEIAQRSDVGTDARIDHDVELLSEHASDGTAWGI